MTEISTFDNYSLFDEMWRDFCAQNQIHENQKDFVGWRLGKFQILKLINEGIAILTQEQELIWSNHQFQTWFPKANEPKIQKNILAVMDSPLFLYDETSQAKYTNPFTEYQVTGNSARGIIQTKGGNVFEIAVHRWTCQGCDDPFMLLYVHDATERRELKNKLTNLHNMCELFSHIDVLKEQKGREARENFLIEGIQYMAKSLLHYEFLEVRKFDPATKTLPLCTHYGLLKEAERRQIHAARTENGTIGFVAVEQKTYICRDTRNDPHYLPGGETARSSLTVPITFQGELLGILNAESSQPDAFKANDQLYAEIFAHEIALAMNLVRAFATEQEVGRQTSAEEIHGQVALPIKKILDLAAELGGHLGEEQIEAQHALYQIIKNAMNVNQIIRNVGRHLTPTSLVAPPDRQEIMVKWFDEFSGKRILLVDSSEMLYRQGCELFDCLKCELDWATTGQVALDKLEMAFQDDAPYFAILSTIKPEGYRLSTQFFLDLAKFYGKKHPPLVLLQELNVYDADHTIVNVRMRYPASGQTGKPFVEQRLLEIIDRTINKIQNTEPCFLPLNGEYDDPMAERRE